ncbi:hypothetical protein BDZ97DRAFT_1837440 [Flammula alnicola]|nr:hypothetical protein BDZ97DRAFT_1837440 [Flammula alnicola]
MPESKVTGLPAASLEALLLALGLSELQNAVEKPNLKTTESMSGIPNFVGKEFPVSGPDHERPTTPFSHLEYSAADEAQIFGRDFLSDFDICSDLDGDSDLDLGTLPSRPGSSSESFEIIDADVVQRHKPVSSRPSFRSSNAAPNAAGPIYIKVAHNACIIMLRTPRDISFADLKRRLYDKFVNQQNIFLSHAFSVVLAVPPKSPHPEMPGCRRVSFASCTEMRFIDRESDWRRITSTNDGSKITLRILDTPP